MAVTWIAADPQAVRVITILNHSLFSRDHNVRASHWQNWDSQSTSGAMRFVCSIACTHQEQKHQKISRQKVFRASVQKHQPNHQGWQDSKLQCTVCPITLTISHWLAPKVASLHSRAKWHCIQNSASNNYYWKFSEASKQLINWAFGTAVVKEADKLTSSISPARTASRIPVNIPKPMS